MAELSEKLGLNDPAEQACDFFVACSSDEIMDLVTADRAAVVAAVALWLMGQGYGGDRLTRGEVDALIRRELLMEDGEP